MEYLQPTIGFFSLLFLGAMFSENIKAIKLKYVVSGVYLLSIIGSNGENTFEKITVIRN